MNKKILGASAAATVLAVMPLLGVFVVEPDSVIDTIKITVPDSCNLQVAEGKGKTIAETINIGQVREDLAGSEFTIACNKEGAWSLAAQGTAKGGTANALNPAAEGEAIKSSSEPSTNLKVNAETSDWGFKLDSAETETEIQSTFDSWHQIPEGSTKVAGGTAADSTQKVKVTYGVAISNTQKAVTYTGEVTYTLTMP